MCATTNIYQDLAYLRNILLNFKGLFAYSNLTSVTVKLTNNRTVNYAIELYFYEETTLEEIEKLRDPRLVKVTLNSLAAKLYSRDMAE